MVVSFGDSNVVPTFGMPNFLHDNRCLVSLEQSTSPGSILTHNFHAGAQLGRNDEVAAKAMMCSKLGQCSMQARIICSKSCRQEQGAGKSSTCG